MSLVPSRVVLLWLVGVIAAGQLAKMSVLAPALADRFALDPIEIGFLISLLEVGGALFGFVAGMLLGRMKAQHVLKSGLFVLSTMTAVEALTQTPAVLFVARAIEGLGYLLVVIAAPTIMLTIAQTAAERVRAMLLWSTFVPVGLGIGSSITGLAASFVTPQAAILLWAFGIFLMLLAVAPIRSPAIGREKPMRPTKAACLLSAAFGFYTLCLCGVAGLIPLFVSEQFNAGISVGGLIAGMVSLAALPGTLLAAVAIREIGDIRSGLNVLLAAATLGAAGIGPFIFRTNHLAYAAGLGVLALIFAGVARAVIFARLPLLSDPGGGAGRAIATQGLFTQAGAIGALLGAPIGAAVGRTRGWGGFGIGVSVCMMFLFALVMLAEFAHRSSDTRRGSNG